MGRRRRFGIGLVVVLTAASCGGKPYAQRYGPSAPTSTISAADAMPRDRLLGAVQRITAARTARVALTMVISATDHNATLTAIGTVDVARRRAQMTLATSGASHSSVAVRVVDDTLYFDAGHGWTTAPAATATESETPDPTSALDYLQGVANDVRVVGSETERGVATTRYDATIDLAHALANARDPEQRSDVEQVYRLLGDVQIPASVWIDGGGRLRKLQESIDLRAGAKTLGLPTGSHVHIDQTLELYDFGVAVDIEPPPGVTSAATVAHDLAAQAELIDAWADEQHAYSATQEYTADVSKLRSIDSSLDWGAKITVVVGIADGIENQVVCVSEESESGTTFAFADVIHGLNSSEYYGSVACPKVVGESSFSAFRSHW